MPEFKVGDRVRAIGFIDGLQMTDMVGTIVYIKDNMWELLPIGVEFDSQFLRGHACNTNGRDRGKNGFCRWGRETDFELFVKGMRTCKDRHVFRKGDRVVKINSDGEFNTRPMLPVGATGTIWWAGIRNGHFPHIVVLLDDKYARIRPGPGLLACEHLATDEYLIPYELLGAENRHRWHVCPTRQFRYVGRRINPRKCHEYR